MKIISKKGKHTYDTKCYHGEGNNRVANTTIEWYGGVHNSEGSRVRELWETEINIKLGIRIKRMTTSFF